MHVETARWTRIALGELELSREWRVLDLGSSTLHYRTVEQPYIESDVMAPLRERGLEIVHLDAKQDPGVDVICDLDRANLNLDEMLGQYEVVLMLGVLQCLRGPDRALDIAARLVAPNGVLVLHHPERARRTFDPYDNMLRANPADLVEALERRGLERVRADSVRIDDPRYYRGIVSRASWIPAFGRFWLPLPGFTERLRRALPALRWRQSCVVMRRPASEAGL